jgi:hypothetical protein
MRYVVLAAALLGACSPETEPERPPNPEVTAAPAPVAVAPGPVKLDQAALVGGWSFDRTCASEDAMGLTADGKAYFDEWGQGTWSIDADGRLVLVLRELTPGVEDDGGGAQMVMTFTASEPAGENLTGDFTSPRADIPARAVNALRCPEN